MTLTQHLNQLKLFNAIAAAACSAISIGSSIPAEARPRNCPNVDFYQQPNSYHQERIGGLGDVMDLDIVNTIVEPNGQKWYQFKIFNGRPGQSGAGWKYGWLKASQICQI